MNWFDMAETTEEEKAKKEIAECNYCIRRLNNTMRSLGASQKQREENVMVKTYLDRIEKAEAILKS